MPAPPLHLSARGVDLSPRLGRTATVAASPALSAETVIASLTITENLAVQTGSLIFGFAAFTVGASGVSANLRIRKTDVSGSILKATGALTVTAADLRGIEIQAFDTAPTLPNQVYVLTLTVGSGAAESTVSAVELAALVV